MVDVEPKDTTKPKRGRRKEWLLAASENPGDLSQGRTAKLGKF